MAFRIKENITWIGKIDWELRKFHGEELSTEYGSSYNSYLIRDQQNIVIDTVWSPYAGEYLKNLAKTIDINSINGIIACHAEPDHSGALPYLISLIPNVPVYCTANGQKSLYGYYHQDWNFQVVKSGTRISIGSKEIIFIEAPMLHWPDTMICYLTGDNILFSNDIFGQHYASEFLFDDLVPKEELLFEAMKYYANIIQPFSKKVTSKLNELEGMNLPIDMICPAHGVIWRNNPKSIFENYRFWASNYYENQITIIYDTMYYSTRRMAEAIAEGIKSVDSKVTIKLFNCSKVDKSDIITEIFKSKGVIIGAPTINNGVTGSIYALLEELKLLNLPSKKAGAFGSYGWSPASIKLINEKLKEANFDLIGEGVKSQWSPDEEKLEECRQYGIEFVNQFN